MDGVAALAVQLRLEEELRDLHANSALDGNLASIWESVSLVLFGGGFGSGPLGIVVLSNEAELLLDVLDDFEFSGGGERVATLEEELLGIGRDFATSDLHLLNGVRDGETFEDWDSMSDTIT